MALIKDYELNGTGVVIPNAYYVITQLDVEKRTKDIESPPDITRPDGRTVGNKEPGKEIIWKAGYVGRMCITIWKDKAARDAGAKPLGTLGLNSPAIYPKDSSKYQGPGYAFFIDITSSKGYTEQAYDHLLTLSDFAGAVSV